MARRYVTYHLDDVHNRENSYYRDYPYVYSRDYRYPSVSGRDYPYVYNPYPRDNLYGRNRLYNRHGKGNVVYPAGRNMIGYSRGILMRPNELLMGGGASNGEWGRAPPPNAHIIYKIGIYGWRKRCLYVFLLLLMMMIIINLALTIWILKVMDFSVDGMGKLRIVKDGIRIEGSTEFVKSVYTSKIRSSGGASLSIESARNITLNARDEENKIVNKLVIGDQKLESYANRFELRNPSGKLLFSADDRQVFIGADRIAVEGSGGASFTGSVQTPLVKPASSEPLRVESPTSTLHISGTQGVHMRAPGGGISLDALTDIVFKSETKAIRLNAKNITMKNILISRAEFDGSPYAEVYQLCVCGTNGKLFLSPSRGNCQATISICN